MKHHAAEQDEFQDIREAIAKLCAQFPGEYWRKLDREMAYPTEFVQALTESGYLGVQVAGARFEACIRHQGRTIHLGTFDTAELAHAAYLARKREIHPFSTLAAAA